MRRRLMLVGVFSLLTISCGRVGFDSLAVDAVDADSPDAEEEVCDGGACTLTCQPGLTECSGGCTDTKSDSLHCGGCDDGAGSNTCGSTEACSIGTCLPLVPRELLVNGDFAAGLEPWATANNPVNDNDNMVVWIIVAEQASNSSSFGPSAKILTQDFVVPSDVHQATFALDFFQDVSFGGGGAAALDPENVLVIEKDPFDVGGGILQNAFRIDLIDPAFDHFYAPILHELYAPTDTVGAIDALEPILIADESLLAFLRTRTGQTLRLRIAQVESTFPWPVLVDNLSLSTLTF